MNKKNFDTIRDLEGQYLGLFRKAGIIGIVGIIIAIAGFGILTALGVALIVIAAAIFLYGMMVMITHQREPTKTVYCPYCASKNELFVTRKEFSCDVCNRRIRMGSSGEPIPIEPIDEDDD